MKYINLNIPLSIFAAGTVLFLLAPVMTFGSYSADQIFIAGIFIQLVGVIASLIVFYRYKVTEKILKEI